MLLAVDRRESGINRALGGGEGDDGTRIVDDESGLNEGKIGRIRADDDAEGVQWG